MRVPKAHTKTRFQMDRYLKARYIKYPGQLSEAEEKTQLRAWLTSMIEVMSSDTIRSILMTYYSETMVNTAALEVLSNPKILNLEEV